MIYPKYCKFKTQTMYKQQEKDRAPGADLTFAWGAAKQALKLSPLFPPIVYTFYQDCVEFVHRDDFNHQELGLQEAVKFLSQQLQYNAVMRGGAVIFRSVTDEKVGLSALYLWKESPAMLRIAQDCVQPDQFVDYVYRYKMFQSDVGTIDPYTMFPYFFLNRDPSLLVNPTNKHGNDHTAILNYIWRIVAEVAKKSNKNVLTVRPTLTLVFHDRLEVHDLSQFTYSDWAGFGLTAFVDGQKKKSGLLANVIVCTERSVEKDKEPKDYLTIRYSAGDLHTIRTSEVIWNSAFGFDRIQLKPYEENLAFGDSKDAPAI